MTFGDSCAQHNHVWRCDFISKNNMAYYEQKRRRNVTSKKNNIRRQRYRSPYASQAQNDNLQKISKTQRPRQAIDASAAHRKNFSIPPYSHHVQSQLISPVRYKQRNGTKNTKNNQDKLRRWRNVTEKK